MSQVTKHGVEGGRPPRDAMTGVANGDGRSGKGNRGEQPMVPKASFESYYGMPILNGPVWHSPEIPGYLFLGGLAGASSVLAVAAQVTGRQELATRTKVVATGAIGLSAVALVADLGKPSRFYNMLRVVKPTSPMSVGSWILAAYSPAAALAAGAALLGRFPRLGALASAGAAALGPAVATYTAALLSDTAVPAWHDGFHQMPFVFAGSSATAAGGMALITSPVDQTGPARRLALMGVAVEAVAARRMEQRLGMVAEPYHEGTAGRLMKAGQAAAAAGLVLAFAGRRNRVVSVLAGASLAAAAAFTRFGIFEAGKQSAADPKYTVEPQRRRRRPSDG